MNIDADFAYKHKNVLHEFNSQIFPQQRQERELVIVVPQTKMAESNFRYKNNVMSN